MIKILKEVFSKRKYLLISVLTITLFYSLNILVLDYQATNRFRLLNLFSFHKLMTTSSLLTLIIISILFGILVGLISYKTKILKQLSSNKIGAIGSIGIFLGVLAPGCAACGVGIAALLGLGAFFQFLPFKGLEISLVSILLLTYSIYLISKSLLNGNVCNSNIPKVKGGINMEENQNNTITIRKDTLWKYSTIVLGVILILVVAFAILPGKSSTGNAVNTGAQGAAADLSVFLENPSLYPSLGPENAKNVVIEFSDFQCPYCALASGLPSWTAQYSAQYGDLIGSAAKVQAMAEAGDLRFIYVSMSFLGAESVLTAQAGLCANDQGLFWEMHDAIFITHDGTENEGVFTNDVLKSLASGIDGMDKAKFNNCLDSGGHKADVQTIASQASTAATGTPTFYVNGQKLSGSWTQLSAALA